MTKFQMMILFLLLAVGTPHSVSSQQQLPRPKSNKPGLVGDLRVGVPAWPVDADEGRPQLLIRQEEDGWFRFLQTSLRETPAQSIGVACEPNLEPVTKIIAPAASDPPPQFPGKLSEWHGFARFDFEFVNARVSVKKVLIIFRAVFVATSSVFK